MASLVSPSHRISYTIDGPEGLPWLILINGLATDMTLWEPQMVAFRQSRRVVRYDLRGHGGSTMPEGEFEVADLAGDVVALMDHLGVVNADVAGISLGAMTALSLSLSHPQRVRTVAICNARVTMPSVAVADWRRRIDLVEADGIDAIAEQTLERWFTTNVDAQVRAHAGGMISGTSAAGYRACAAAITRMNLEPALRDLKVRSLFLAGEHDGAAPPDVMASMAEAAGGDARVIEGAAHLPNLERPASFNAVLGEWLQS